MTEDEKLRSRGVSKFEFSSEQKQKLRELCERYFVTRLMLFGSDVNGDFDPSKSDLDFVAVFHRPAPNMNAADQYFGFKNELESLFMKVCDVVELKAVDNPYILREIDDTAITVYAA